MNLPFRPFLRRCRRCSSFGNTTVGILLFVFAPVVSGMDFYLKIKDVPGEITTGGLTGWTQLTRLSADTVRPLPVPPATVTTSVPGVRFSKTPGAVSSLLITRCAEGTVVPRMVLLCRDGTAPAQRITLQDVSVLSYRSAGGGAAGEPQESFGCRFKSIEWSYADPNGNTGGITATFNVPGQSGSSKVRVPFRATCDDNLLARGGLRVTCPVEAGHTYQVAGTLRLTGPWQPLRVFTAVTDGLMDVTIPKSGPVLFLRVEEVD